MSETQATGEAPAATSTEGQAASTTAATEAATAVATAGQTQQATEGQTTEATTTAEAGKTEGEQAKPQGAPEKYEFKAAEGQEFDPKVLEAFSEVAKELNLPQEAAQKVIDKIAPELAAKQERVLTEARTQWVAQVKADPEIGGADVADKIALANKAFTDFGTPELRKLLDETGIGDHPEMIRWAHRVGKAISEDGFVAGKGAKATETTAQRMYPGMNP